LIVFQTQSCFLGIVCLNFKEDSVFIDLIDFLCDAVRFGLKKLGQYRLKNKKERMEKPEKQEGIGRFEWLLLDKMLEKLQ